MKKFLKISLLAISGLLLAGTGHAQQQVLPGFMNSINVSGSFYKSVAGASSAMRTYSRKNFPLIAGWDTVAYNSVDTFKLNFGSANNDTISTMNFNTMGFQINVDSIQGGADSANFIIQETLGSAYGETPRWFTLYTGTLSYTTKNFQYILTGGNQYKQYRIIFNCLDRGILTKWRWQGLLWFQ